MAVNQDRIRKWVEALRSGKYKQGQNALRTEQGYYCCLGVACEVFRETTGTGDWVPEKGFGVGYGVVDYSNDTLPTVVSEWFGFPIGIQNPVLKKSTDGITKENATHLNDTLGYSFDEIAKVIEEKYLDDSGPCEAS